MQFRSPELLATLLLLGCTATQAVHAQAPAPMSTAVIVENVHIFNGSTDRLSTSSNVLEVGNVIKTSSSAPIADLLLVDGDPLENIKLVEDPAKNFLVIMKDGKLYKNLLL